MSEVVLIIIASLVACVVLAVVVWLRVKSDFGPLKSNGEPHGKENEESAMKAGDWFDAVINVGIGVLLGVAMAASGSWFVAVLIPLLAAVLFFYMSLFDRLIDKVFPSGIRPAHKSKKVRKAPLVKRLSLPLGLVLGIVLAALGLGDRFLGWLL